MHRCPAGWGIVTLRASAIQAHLGGLAYAPNRLIGLGRLNPMDSGPPTPDSLPHVAVVICTRHRPPSVADAVRSALASRPAASCLIVVDQADAETADPLAKFDGLARFVRIRHDAVGLSRGRNVGAAAAAAAGATIIAYTDDDCVAEPSWLSGFDAAFAGAADIAAVFGTVRAAPYDRTTGIIPAYNAHKSIVMRGLANKARAEGIGACMAVRVDAWRQLDGFDDWLGAGTSLASGEDTDLIVRLLHSGFAVAETPAAEVIHHGFRDWPSCEPLVAGYMRGIGAVNAKMIRLAGIGGLAPLATLGGRWLTGRPVVDLNHLPPRWFRLRRFLEGATTGWKLPIDRRSGRFLPIHRPGDLTPPTTSLG
jgi:GT2 family glycosyltransferase